jgi:hypothetical protein
VDATESVNTTLRAGVAAVELDDEAILMIEHQAHVVPTLHLGYRHLAH